MSWLRKIIITIVIYLLIGTTLGLMRHGHGGGGLESFFALITYPVLWPMHEYRHFKDGLEKQKWDEDVRVSLLAELCPPEFHSLFYGHVLDGKALPPYNKMLKALRANPPAAGDRRSGYVLHKLGEAAAGAGNLDVLSDAAALLNSPDAGAGNLLIAGAIARGVFGRGQSADTEKNREERIRALKIMTQAYERALPPLYEAGRPQADLAMGTLYQAAGRYLPEAENAGMTDKARAAYLRAAVSGKISASLPAVIQASSLAENDAERKKILARFLVAIDSGGKSWAETPLSRPYWTVAVLTKRRAEAAAGFRLGQNLLPTFDSGLESAIKVVEEDGWDRGIHQAWEDFMFLFTRSVDDFSNAAEMLSDILEYLLPPDTDIIGEIRDRNEVSGYWTVYYRLYEETKDERWLTAAGETLLSVRPSLKYFEHLLAAEVAFMHGEYRRHGLSVARHLVSPSEASSNGDVGRFTSRYLEKLMRAKRVNTPWGYDYWFNLNLFAGELERRRYYDRDGSELRAMAEKIYRGEWPTDSHEIIDSDVTEIPEGERH